MTTAFPQMTSVEQFRQMPAGPYQYELIHGEVVASSLPKHGQVELQYRLYRLLSPVLAEFGPVEIELPYRPFREFELRAADVAAVSTSRRNAIDPEDNLHGAPDLVIEVKTPAVDERQLCELACTCLNTGATQVWVIDTDRKSITVMRRDGVPAVFAAGEVLVDEIFG